MNNNASPTTQPEIVTWTNGQVNRLATGYINNDPTAIAALAALRKCADGKIHNDPLILEWTLTNLAPGAYKEWAAALTLGLFATVQRANRNSSTQNNGVSFMRAVSGMAKENEEWTNGLNRQVRFLLGTDTPDSLAHRLRALARMMNTANVSCDWGWFAFQLEQWANPSTRDRTRIRWGRDFYAPIKPKTKTSKTKATNK